MIEVVVRLAWILVGVLIGAGGLGLLYITFRPVSPYTAQRLRLGRALSAVQRRDRAAFDALALDVLEADALLAFGPAAAAQMGLDPEQQARFLRRLDRWCAASGTAGERTDVAP